MLKSEAEMEVRNAEPVLEAANRAVDLLDKNDISELKVMKTANENILPAIRCVMTYLGYGNKSNDWQTALKMLADVGFIKRIKDFDKEHVDPKIMDKVRKIINDKS